MKYFYTLLLAALFFFLNSQNAWAEDKPRFTFGAFAGGGVGRTGGVESNGDDYRFLNGMAFAQYAFSDYIEARLALGVDQYFNVREIFSLTRSTASEKNDLTLAAEWALLFNLRNRHTGNFTPYLFTGARFLGANAILGFGTTFRMTDHVNVFTELDVNSVIFDSKLEGRVGVSFGF